MKTAVIGLGRMGLRHARIVQDMGLDLCAAADPRPASRDAAVEQGLAPAIVFDDAIAMLEAVRPECVIVASTAPSHCELVCAAARSGARLILCEKPMAVSIGECDRMIAACEATGTRLAVNHQMRFMEQYTRTREIVASEAFGGLASANVVAGNCGLANNGSHYFEMFRFLTGEMPAAVTARFSAETVPNPRGAEFEDRGGWMRVVTPTGRRLYIEASVDQGYGMAVIYAGRHGSLFVDELQGRMLLSTRAEADRPLPTTRFCTSAQTQELTIAPTDALTPSRAVLKALIEGHDVPDGTVGRMAVEVLVAAYVSHERGGEEIILTDTPLPRDRVFAWA